MPGGNKVLRCSSTIEEGEAISSSSELVTTRWEVFTSASSETISLRDTVVIAL